MIVYYQKPTYLEYNLDIEDFIKFLMSDYVDVMGNHWNELDFRNEDVVCEFVDDFVSNTEWYLERYGCEVHEYFSDENLDDICNEVLSRMEELDLIKKI